MALQDYWDNHPNYEAAPAACVLRTEAYEEALAPEIYDLCRVGAPEALLLF